MKLGNLLILSNFKLFCVVTLWQSVVMLGNLLILSHFGLFCVVISWRSVVIICKISGIFREIRIFFGKIRNLYGKIWEFYENAIFRENSDAGFFGRIWGIYENAIRSRDCDNLYKKTPRTISSLEMVNVTEVTLLGKIVMKTLQAQKVRMKTNEGHLRLNF